MNNIRALLSIVMSLLTLSGATFVAAQDDAQAKIDSALSAAPPSIAENATVLDNDVDEAGRFILLREGTSGWYCFPDVISSPGNDPLCGDVVWLDFLYALVAGEEPIVTTVGYAYMLAGGSEASTSDPSFMEPPEGEDWVTTPPHIMLLLPGDWDTSLLSTDHMAPGPWLMWADTPYQHIMMPVSDTHQIGALSSAHLAVPLGAQNNVECSPLVMGTGECRGTG